MSIKFKICIILFILSISISNAQKDKNIGKLRVALENYKQYKFTKDTCYMYVYKSDSIIEKINLSDYMLYDIGRNISFVAFYIKGGAYTIIMRIKG